LRDSCASTIMVMPRCRIPILIVAGFLPRLPRYRQAFTGRTAIHQASSQSFDERAASQDPDGGSSHG
jgi:hypothetical protein